MNNNNNNLEFLDLLSIITSYLQFHSLHDTDKIQEHLREIDDKLDWIIAKLGER